MYVFRARVSQIRSFSHLSATKFSYMVMCVQPNLLATMFKQIMQIVNFMFKQKITMWLLLQTIANSQFSHNYQNKFMFYQRHFW